MKISFNDKMTLSTHQTLDSPDTPQAISNPYAVSSSCIGNAPQRQNNTPLMSIPMLLHQSPPQPISSTPQEKLSRHEIMQELKSLIYS